MVDVVTGHLMDDPIYRQRAIFRVRERRGTLGR
jgi:hypothetical protein